MNAKWRSASELYKWSLRRCSQGAAAAAAAAGEGDAEPLAAVSEKKGSLSGSTARHEAPVEGWEQSVVMALRGRDSSEEGKERALGERAKRSERKKEEDERSEFFGKRKRLAFRPRPPLPPVSCFSFFFRPPPSLSLFLSLPLSIFSPLSLKNQTRKDATTFSKFGFLNKRMNVEWTKRKANRSYPLTAISRSLVALPSLVLPAAATIPPLFFLGVLRGAHQRPVQAVHVREVVPVVVAVGGVVDRVVPGACFFFFFFFSSSLSIFSSGVSSFSSGLRVLEKEKEKLSLFFALTHDRLHLRVQAVVNAVGPDRGQEQQHLVREEVDRDEKQPDRVGQSLGDAVEGREGQAGERAQSGLLVVLVVDVVESPFVVLFFFCPRRIGEEEEGGRRKERKK